MLLNEYLAAIQSGAAMRGQPVRLTFYTHPPSAAQTEAERDAAAEQPSTTPSEAATGPQRSPAHRPPQPSAATPDGEAAGAASTPGSAESLPELQRVSLIFATDFFHVSAFRPPSASSSSSPLSALAIRQIHDNLTSLFAAMGIVTPLVLPDDLASAAASSSSPFSSADDEDFDLSSVRASASDVSLPTFLSSVAAVALHKLHEGQVARSRRTLHAATLRLQGVRTVFQCKEGEEMTVEEQAAVLSRFQAVIARVPQLRDGLNLSGMRAAEGERAADEEERMQRERKEAEAQMGMREDGEAAGGGASPQPQPMSQRAGMPFSRLMSQIRRSHLGGEEAAEAAQEAGRRSPLLSTTTVFCCFSSSSHVDNRGRVVLALQESDAAWEAFLSSPSSFPLAASRLSAFQQCKALEQQTAALLRLHDLYAELTLTGTAPYVAYLLSLQQSAHHFHALLAAQPALRSLSLRVSTLPAPSVDSELGIVLLPIATPPAAIVAFLQTHGRAALTVQSRYQDSERRYDETLLAVKRRYRLRRLDRQRGLPMHEMLHCCDRLLRMGGGGGGGGEIGGLRGLMEGLEIAVGREFRFEHEAGTVIIPWDWRLSLEQDRQRARA